MALTIIADKVQKVFDYYESSINEEQLVSIVEELVSTYWVWKVEQLNYFLNKVKFGEFGEMYGKKLTVPTFMRFAKAYEAKLEEIRQARQYAKRSSHDGLKKSTNTIAALKAHAPQLLEKFKKPTTTFNDDEYRKHKIKYYIDSASNTSVQRRDSQVQGSNKNQAKHTDPTGQDYYGD